MIEVDHLTRSFGSLMAVEDLTLAINPGEVFGLLGPNGAGKTTTMRMLSCLIHPTSGSARIHGLEITKPADVQEIRRIVGVLPEEVGLTADLTAVETLEYFGKVYGVPRETRRDRIESLLTTLGLWDRRNTRAGTYSRGMRQRLALARALIHDPQVLFLDEPTANLDPAAAKVVRDLLDDLRQRNRTILLNTHQLTEAERMCDRVAILQNRLVAVGRPEDLRASAWTHKTRITLANATDEVLSALSAAGWVTERDGDTVTVSVDNPATDNPRLVDAVIAAGGRILWVTDLMPSLEDVYLWQVGERA